MPAVIKFMGILKQYSGTGVKQSIMELVKSKSITELV